MTNSAKNNKSRSSSKATPAETCGSLRRPAKRILQGLAFTGAGQEMWLCILRGVAFSWNGFLIPLHERRCGKLWRFPQQNILRTKCLRLVVLLSVQFFVWLYIMQYGNLSYKSGNVFSNPKIIMCSTLKFWGHFSTSCPFSPLPKMKIRISSHSLVKPPEFIHCIFPVTHWSVKGFLTNFT